MSEKTNEEGQEVRGLSQLDRIALRIVSGILITGIIGVFVLLNTNTTTLAVVQNDVKNLVATTRNDLNRLDARVDALENALSMKTEDRYTYKDALRDQEVIKYQIKDLDKRVNKLEKQ